MSKKEELIKDMAEYFENAGLVLPEAIGRANWFYNKIRASILTPKVVALMKAIGERTWSSCDVCNFRFEKGGRGTGFNSDHCLLKKNKHCSQARLSCPLLTSEERAELTE